VASNIKQKRAEVSPTVINEYLNNLSAELYGVDPDSIWNYNENNLMDEPGQKKVIISILYFSIYIHVIFSYSGCKSVQ